MRWCKHCGTEIPPGRLKIVPNADSCVSCLEKNGDVQTPVGYMHYYHKTAPALIITTKENLKDIVRGDRRGNKKAAKE